MKTFKFAWEEESINNFWNMYSEVIPKEYFSKKFGGGILRFVKSHIKLQRRVLDFGCEPGWLLKRLANISNIKLCGVDYSNVNVSIAKEQLNSYKNFDSVELLSESFFKNNHNSFNIVFLIECLEHILPSENQNFLREIGSLFASQGKIVINRIVTELKFFISNVFIFN